MKEGGRLPAEEADSTSTLLPTGPGTCGLTVLSLLLLSLNRQWTADGLLLFKSRLVGFLSELTTNSTGESRLCYMPAD